MQLKSRYVLTALALLVAMTMATTAMAQVSLTVSSTPTSRVRNNDHTALVGDVSLTIFAVGADPTGGTLTLDYAGLGITNAQSGGAANTHIEVVGTGCFNNPGTTGLDSSFPAAADGLDDADVTVNNNAGTIVLNMFAGAGCAVGHSITISNVHVTVAGSGLSSLNANVSTSPGSGYLITAGQNNPTVISSIQDPLVDANLSSSGPGTARAVALTNGLIPPGGGAFAFRLTENFFDALMDAADLGIWALNDVAVTFTFSGLPAGVTLTGLTATDNVNGNGAGGALVLSNTTINNTAVNTSSTTMTYPGALVLASNAVDTITIAGTLTVAGNATLPLPPSTVTVTANITPTGNAFGPGGVVLNPGGNNAFPRFASEPTAPVTVATIVPAQTNMLIPLVTVSAGGFDSGIGIANTTDDNFAAPNGAIEQDGTILFEFFPTQGTPFTYTTSATSPGTGLTNGVLNSGDTYLVLASELLSAAGQGTDFNGYVLITTNFTNAHGNIFLTDFAGFTAGGEVLVMAPPAAGNPRTTVGVEGLNK